MFPTLQIIALYGNSVISGAYEPGRIKGGHTSPLSKVCWWWCFCPLFDKNIKKNEFLAWFPKPKITNKLGSLRYV